jgi:hypothetical protein
MLQLLLPSSVFCPAGLLYLSGSESGGILKKGTIIPLFGLSQDFRHAAVRFLMRMSFDAKAFAAQAIDMAVKGFRIRNPTACLFRKRDRSTLSGRAGSWQRTI